jgi:hypothetical protein
MGGREAARDRQRTDFATTRRATTRDPDLLDFKGLEHEGSEPA